MKIVRNKILSGMMALVLVVSLFATTTGDAYAATEYVDTFTKTYTLRKETAYKIPLDMKKNANLKITMTIVKGTAGAKMYVVPQLWENYDDYYDDYDGPSSPDESFGLGYDSEKKVDRVDKVVFKGKALKGKQSAITIGVGHTGDIKMQVKITCNKKCFLPQDIEIVPDLFI